MLQRHHSTDADEEHFDDAIRGDCLMKMVMMMGHDDGEDEKLKN